jgi:hypothetical protein
MLNLLVRYAYVKDAYIEVLLLSPPFFLVSLRVEKDGSDLLSRTFEPADSLRQPCSRPTEEPKNWGK